MKKYRIPNIDEFIQGFEFQLRLETTYGVAFLHKKLETKYKTIHTWINCQVDWKYKKDDILTFNLPDGRTVSYTGAYANFMKPWYADKLKELLLQKKIRVKI